MQVKATVIMPGKSILYEKLRPVEPGVKGAIMYPSQPIEIISRYPCSFHQTYSNACPQIFKPSATSANWTVAYLITYVYTLSV